MKPTRSSLRSRRPASHRLLLRSHPAAALLRTRGSRYGLTPSRRTLAERPLIPGGQVKLPGSDGKCALVAKDPEAAIALYRLKAHLANTDLLCLMADAFYPREESRGVVLGEITQARLAVEELQRQDRIVEQPGNASLFYQGEEWTSPISLLSLQGRPLDVPKPIGLYRCSLQKDGGSGQEMFALLVVPQTRS